ncbi:MAG TPA: hypothetical protein VFS67_11965 [Polyangiaceae bacterium]|nr:hypothetical protein [Polyangiaceae bacterium]
MRRSLPAWLSGALTISPWLAPSLARAELVPRPDARRTALQSTLALEPELTLSAALLFPLRLDSPRAVLSLGAGVKWAVLLPTRGDLQLSLGAAGSYLVARDWGAACAASALATRAQNEAATFYGLGLELRCQPGYFHGAWSVGLDLGLQSALSTHVEHSATARSTFEERYPPGVTGITGPRDGWYRFTATRFRVGVASSHRWGDHWSGVLALGSLFARQDQGLLLAFNLAQLPIYLELGAGYAW